MATRLGPACDYRRAVTVAAIGVGPLIAGLAGLGGIGSYTTVRTAAEPYFGTLAWIVPVGMDVGIVILLAWDLLMEYVGMAWPVLRWVAWAYIGATIAVNTTAAHGDPAGMVMHAAMPVLFVTVVEGVRHLIRQWAGLADGTRMEKIPAVRWVLAPVSSAMLWRRMVLWAVSGYRDGLRLEYERLLTVSRLQQEYGRWAWRWKAPLSTRLALRLHGAQTILNIPAPTAEKDWWKSQPSSPRTLGQVPAWISDELLEAARRIITNAEHSGVRVSKAALGARLREEGFTIANGRVTELVALIGDESEACGVEDGRQLPRSDNERRGGRR
jgi:Protein of unknown function (DUF2637)